MENSKYLEQLEEIQTMMRQSSRFLSLSGISGILAGTYALIGAFVVYSHRGEYASVTKLTYTSPLIIRTAIVALSIMLCSILTGIYFSSRKARKKQELIWSPASRQFLTSLFIPLVTGGVFALILLGKNEFSLISPVTLIFYGLGLVNASRYTYPTMRNLGLIFIVLGLINTIMLRESFLLWTFGFGVCHIAYGLFMYLKYDRKAS